jgi:flagellar hook-associated protein FlgK
MTTTMLNIAVAGLRAAETRVHVRAQNVVNWLSEGYVRQVPVQTSQAGGPVVRVQRPAELSGDFPYVDLATELVDMQLAKHAYRASAKVVRTADEMTRSLLDVIA